MLDGVSSSVLQISFDVRELSTAVACTSVCLARPDSTLYRSSLTSDRAADCEIAATILVHPVSPYGPGGSETVHLCPVLSAAALG